MLFGVFLTIFRFFWGHPIALALHYTGVYATLLESWLKNECTIGFSLVATWEKSPKVQDFEKDPENRGMLWILQIWYSSQGSIFHPPAKCAMDRTASVCGNFDKTLCADKFFRLGWLTRPPLRSGRRLSIELTLFRQKGLHCAKLEK